MSSTQFTALIRLPFARGNFEDPPQLTGKVQWDAEKDRQLWKVISKSSRTSDLNWVELATKFQVPPTFLLQQAAWLYERHLDHVRNQMKRVSISNVATSPTPTGGSTLTAVGGVAMRRTGSAGSGAARTTSAMSGRPRDSPSLRGGETFIPAPPLSRTPSTNTITQSRASTQQVPARTQSTRSAQRPNLTSPKPEERPSSSTAPPPNYRKDQVESPDLPASPSSSSSSLSDTDHPAHRSQLFKRPPRFKQQRPRELSTFHESDGTQEVEDSGSHGNTSLPFASAARRKPSSSKYAQDTLFRTTAKPEQKILQAERARNVPPLRHKSIDQQSQTTAETASSMTSSASASDAPGDPRSTGKTPMSPPSNHRADLGRLGSPRQQGPRSRKEGSEGTPSMGSSFSDIDDAGISQSALEEALLSNMQHGRMSTLSRMSRFI
ncbi:Nn.00g037420.m01.CDS01 [Neocucurbitaria sp. VM-36]